MTPDAPSAVAASKPSWQGAPGRDGLGLAALVCLLYLVVSGGAYGIEDAVRIAGARLTLILCAIIPLTLSLPTALMGAELIALMPLEGGFYFWVKEGLGPFAGFIETYLTLLFSAVDTTIYPVLFATYLAYMIPLDATGTLIVSIALVWVAGLLNLAGIKLIGNSSVVLTIVLTAPFAALVLCGLPRLIHWKPPLQPLAGHDFLGALGGGLTVVMWNFSGWENVSVVAGELERPGRNYVRAIAITLPMVALGYLLPLGVTLSGVATTAQWRTGWFAMGGRILGGPWLEAGIALGGAVSAFAMFAAAMLWVPRLPFVLATEGYLPRGLAGIWHSREVPARSILACCVVFTILVPLGFMTLVVLDVLFYMMALMLEMGALLRLRGLRPDREGLFVIGGGRLGLYLVVGAPLVTWLATFGFALTRSGARHELGAAIVLLSCAWPLYRLLGRRYGGPQSEPSRG